MRNPKVNSFYQLKERVIEDLKIDNRIMPIENLLDMKDAVLDYLYTLPPSDKRLDAVITVTEETDIVTWSVGYHKYVKPLL